MVAKLFDAKIAPVVLYGSELWGLDKCASACDSLHMFALKKFLGVESRTPNDLIYGETNRYPLSILAAIRCIKYWLKLITMEHDRWPRKAYDMLFALDVKGYNNWVSNIRQCLCENGFGHVWYFQGVAVQSQFIKELRQRLIDCRWQKWSDHIQESERFSMYRVFIGSHDIKPYLL